MSKRPAPIGARLREAREQAGLSQRALAAKVGVTFPHISNIERKTEPASAALISRIAKELDLDSDELILQTGALPDWIRSEVERDPLGALEVIGPWATKQKQARSRRKS